METIFYLFRGREQENHCSSPAWQKVNETCISTNSLVIVACIYKPSYEGGIGKKIVVWAGPGKKHKPLSKK
jgi:hypothetical protein